MSMSDPLNHLGSILYHSEPLEVPYSPNQFLGLDFFAASYSKLALEKEATGHSEPKLIILEANLGLFHLHSI